MEVFGTAVVIATTTVSSFCRFGATVVEESVRLLAVVRMTSCSSLDSIEEAAVDESALAVCVVFVHSISARAVLGSVAAVALSAAVEITSSIDATVVSNSAVITSVVVATSSASMLAVGVLATILVSFSVSKTMLPSSFTILYSDIGSNANFMVPFFTSSGIIGLMCIGLFVNGAPAPAEAIVTAFCGFEVVELKIFSPFSRKSIMLISSSSSSSFWFSSADDVVGKLTRGAAGAVSFAFPASIKFNPSRIASKKLFSLVGVVSLSIASVSLSSSHAAVEFSLSSSPNSSEKKSYWRGANPRAVAVVDFCSRRCEHKKIQEKAKKTL